MTTDAPGKQTANLPPLARAALGLVLDYARWSQIVPMLTAWGAALLMLAALLLVTYQEQALAGLADLSQWLYRLPWLGDYLQARAATSDGTLKITGSDLEIFALRAWMWASLALTLIATAIGCLFGPLPTMGYKRKAMLSIGSSLLMFAGFMAVFLTGREHFNGDMGGWIFTFGAIAMMLFLVSLWCLGIAHLLGLLKGLLGEQQQRKKPLRATDFSELRIEEEK